MFTYPLSSPFLQGTDFACKFYYFTTSEGILNGTLVSVVLLYLYYLQKNFAYKTANHQSEKSSVVILRLCTVQSTSHQ